MLRKTMEDKNGVFMATGGRLQLNIGAYVLHIPSNISYKVIRNIDFQHIEGKDASGNSKVLSISQLGLVEQSILPQELSEIADEDWVEAEKRHAVIEPILRGEIHGRAAINEYAQAVSVSAATLYRWVKKFKTTGSLSSLVDIKRGWVSGRSRLTAEQDTLIGDAIKKYYLTNQRLSQQKVIQQIRILCHQRNIKPPAEASIRKRIHGLSEREVLSGRGHREKARNKFQPKPGAFPSTRYPLDVIQIDHTPVDLILVDDETRLPIGRPWLTLAIDVNSRMVCGYYLSLDAPSEISVAICIAQSILPKDQWLAQKQVLSNWDVWGIPKKIHVDNGADFRTETLKRGCLEYGITLEYRPVRVPHYGAHIERLLGTFMHEVHQISGTTFSNVQQKDNYDSEKNAIMTFDELEVWLLKLITNVYHKSIHSSLSMTPETKWNEGIFGHGNLLGCGLPDIPANPQKLLMDFMPFTERTIQPNGVSWDGIRYFDYVLTPFINLKENGKKRKYIFRRDPRDVSVIYFFNPVSKMYIPLPSADQNMPPISHWQLREAKQKLRERGLENYNEHIVIQTVLEMQEQNHRSQKATKKARRKAQRDRLHQRKDSPVSELAEGNKPASHEIYKAMDETSGTHTHDGMLLDPYA